MSKEAVRQLYRALLSRCKQYEKLPPAGYEKVYFNIVRKENWNDFQNVNFFACSPRPPSFSAIVKDCFQMAASRHSANPFSEKERMYFVKNGFRALRILNSEIDTALLWFKANVKYERGQIFRHKLSGNRGVIIEVDPTCNLSEDWIEKNNIDKLERGRTQPFYHTIIENEEEPQYVAQEHIELLSNCQEGIQHQNPILKKGTFDKVTSQYQFVWWSFGGPETSETE